MNISVIICCYNSVDRITPTLQHLAQQVLIDGLMFEIILVDNNSTDGTSAFAESKWRNMSLNIPLRIVYEPRPGLTNARKKGIESSVGDIIIFCDDDNWLDEGYIKNVYDLFRVNRYKLVGGWGIAVAEVELPSWFKQFDGCGYAVGKQGRTTGVGKGIQGAGMAIRRKDALILLDHRFSPFLTDRKGSNLSTGGDAEICNLINKDLRFFDERLIYHHHLTFNRLNWNYYLKLNYFIGLADSYLYFYKLIKDKKLLARKKYLAKLSLSIIELTKLMVKALNRRISLKEEIRYQYLRAFVLSLTLNLFNFSRNYSQALNNSKLFMNMEGVL